MMDLDQHRADFAAEIARLDRRARRRPVWPYVVLANVIAFALGAVGFVLGTALLNHLTSPLPVLLIALVLLLPLVLARAR